MAWDTRRGSSTLRLTAQPAPGGDRPEDVACVCCVRRLPFQTAVDEMCFLGLWRGEGEGGGACRCC